MIIDVGESLHIMFRTLHDQSIRRHFIGRLLAVDNSLCRLEGYFFVYDERKTEFVRIADKRTIIVDLSTSALIFNVIAPDVVLEDVRYRYAPGVGFVATDGKSFALNIHEFGAKN